MLNLDPFSSPFAMPRSSTYAGNGMVATSQSLAAEAGLEMLRAGGNGVDAAVAAAAALTVVEPTSNGIGSDASAIVCAQDELYGLNASGPSPHALTPEALTRAGHSRMPEVGWEPVTVPGAPAAWAALAERFGTLPLTRLLEPAARYAAEGFPVSAAVARGWHAQFERFRASLHGDRFAPWFELFAPQGRAPYPGEVWRAPDMAQTLRRIAESGADSFYRGAVAEAIDAASRKDGGYLCAADLAEFAPEWVRPISATYRGFDVWELPPNGQGLVALLALNVLSELDSPAAFDDAQAVHQTIEAVKLSLTDGMAHIADPQYMEATVPEMLGAKWAARLRRRIGDRAVMPSPTPAKPGGTVYLATADRNGMMVSFIQSNYMGFGSGIVVPGTGISLQNRGACFSSVPGHPNCVGPGKRTYHTIIPAFLTEGDTPLGPFGVMGGLNQPQAHVQVVRDTVDLGLHPQAALDAPRWRWLEEKRVAVEAHTPRDLISALERRGHDIVIEERNAGFGRGQIIWRDPSSGILTGGTDSRADGTVASY